MWKKTFAILVTFSLLFAITAPIADTVDARGKYRSPSRSFTPTPPKQDVNTQAPRRTDQVNNGPQTNNPATARPGTGTAAGQGLFGGGMMRGLLLGGMAGLLFGSLLANMGALGPILGLLVNIIALYVLFVVIRKVVQYFMNRRRDDSRYPR